LVDALLTSGEGGCSQTAALHRATPMPGRKTGDFLSNFAFSGGGRGDGAGASFILRERFRSD
jgi:hypothetical protein